MFASALDFPNIGPDIFSISVGSFTFALRYYAMAYILGILIGWWIMVRAVQAERLWVGAPPATKEQIDEFITWLIIGVIVGGRLGYVLFYEPARFLAAPLDIVKVWQGGMAFHGGLAGVAIAVIVFARRHAIPLMSLADLCAIGTPVGLFLGRTANFINGELWGRPTDLPWGVIFPGRAAQDCGQAVGEFCARHPSQLYEAGLEGVVLGLVLLWLVMRRDILKAPGLAAGIFWCGYAISRFIVEFVRVADEQFVGPDNPLGHVIRLGDAGLSMGQLLSLPMLALGLFFVWLSRRGRA